MHALLRIAHCPLPIPIPDLPLEGEGKISAERLSDAVSPHPQLMPENRLIKTQNRLEPHHEKRETRAGDAPEHEMVGERERITVQQPRDEQHDAQEVQEVD